MLLRFSLILFVISCGFVVHMQAQQVISLQNPSFEDMPRKGGEFSAPIKGWLDCGQTLYPGESPPDIHPVPANAWEVSKEAYDGETFLGMVTRYNDTHEALSQALTTPIKAGTCYNFSAFIARSEQYKSATSRNTETLENFVRPAVLLIWGGNSFCEKAELLGESPAVSNSTWKQYKFLFQPQKTHKYITIEAFYKTPILEAYNGHVLVDGLSDIVQTQCPVIPQDLIAEVSDPPSKVDIAHSGGSSSNTTIITRPKTSGGTPKPTTETGGATAPAFKAELLPSLVKSKMFVGQKIRVDQLYFKADSVNLLPNSYKVLNEVASFLKAYPKTVIEIGGHTNTIPPDDYCNQISTARAKAVQEYLIAQGVPATRLEYKGYGKTEPLIPYDKYNREARTKNQRVEMKILAL